ncbi:MAG TPA: hypothetical protein VJB98_01670 [Candidatus Paceibacterota bacterium]
MQITRSRFLAALSAAALTFVIACSSGGGPTSKEPPDPHGGFVVTSTSFCYCPMPDGANVAHASLAWDKADRVDPDAFARIIGFYEVARFSCAVTQTSGACGSVVNIGDAVATQYELELVSQGLHLSTGGFPPAVCSTCP